jgi:hypothetical protein
LGELTWPLLDEILTAMGGDQVNEILGLSTRHTSQVAAHAE